MANWHYITKDGQRGPIDERQLRQLYVSSVIGLDTSIWSEGMKSWEPLNYHPNLLEEVARQVKPTIDNSIAKAPASKPNSNRTYSSAPEPEPASFPFPNSVDEATPASQKWVLWGIIVVTFGMLLYPPFQVTYQGTIRNMGYHFLLSPPKLGSLVASVNASFLVIQLVGVVIIGGALWFLVRSSSETNRAVSSGSEIQPSDALQKITFLSLRAIRAITGFVAVWQIIGLLPALTWIDNPAALTPDLVFLLFIKLVFAIVLGFIFVQLRRFINKLHVRWNGAPHPALSKK